MDTRCALGLVMTSRWALGLGDSVFNHPNPTKKVTSLGGSICINRDDHCALAERGICAAGVDHRALADREHCVSGDDHSALAERGLCFAGDALCCRR